MARFSSVVEFEDGKEPSVGFGTEILGGRLCFVSFDDVRERNLTEGESEALREFMGLRAQSQRRMS